MLSVPYSGRIATRRTRRKWPARISKNFKVTLATAIFFVCVDIIIMAPMKMCTGSTQDQTMMKWALIDTSWLAHRARYVIRGLEFKGRATGITFGFFEQLRAVCFDRRVLTNKVALCFDSHYSLRHETFPEYKKRRANFRSPEEQEDVAKMHEQLRVLRKTILPECGFRTYMQTGLESDDLLAQAAKQLEGCGGSIIITSDSDLYQCINLFAHWFDPSRDIYLDPPEFWVKFEVHPTDWLVVKCLSGCHSDNIPGIKGIGKKTAIQYILGELNSTSPRYTSIVSKEGKKTISRNRKLIELPNRHTAPMELPEPNYNPKAFFKWCKELGFDSFLNTGGRRRQWEAFFEGRLEGLVQTPRKRGEAR